MRIGLHFGTLCQLLGTDRSLEFVLEEDFVICVQHLSLTAFSKSIYINKPGSFVAGVIGTSRQAGFTKLIHSYSFSGWSMGLSIVFSIDNCVVMNVVLIFLGVHVSWPMFCIDVLMVLDKAVYPNHDHAFVCNTINYNSYFRLRYDIWGEDVLIGNSMESHGKPGCICQRLS